MEKALECVDRECQNGVAGNHMGCISTPPGVDTTQWVVSVSAHDAKKVVALYRAKFGKTGCGCLSANINVGSVSWGWDCSCKSCGTKTRNLSPNNYVSRLEAHTKNENISLALANEHFRASFRIVSHMMSEHRSCIDVELEGLFTHLVVFGTTFSLLRSELDLAPLISLRQLFHRIYAVHDIESGSVNDEAATTDDFYERSSDEDEASDYNGEYNTSESSSDAEGMDIDSE